MAVTCGMTRDQAAVSAARCAAAGVRRGTTADLAERVVQRVRVAAPAGTRGHRPLEHVPVCGLGDLPPGVPGRGDDPARGAVARRIVREQLELVPGVERDQVARFPPSGEQVTEPREGKDPFRKLLAQHGIAEPPFVFRRKQRELGDHPLREDAAPAVIGSLAARRVTRDAVDAAARRLGLEDVPVKPGGLGSPGGCRRSAGASRAGYRGRR